MQSIHRPNPQDFPLGSVAYFVNKFGTVENGKWRVDFGIVEEHYPGSICLVKIEPVDRRTINGVRHRDFATPTR